eukprot:1644264-Prymnesium_polylepis.1
MFKSAPRVMPPATAPPKEKKGTTKKGFSLDGVPPGPGPIESRTTRQIITGAIREHTLLGSIAAAYFNDGRRDVPTPPQASQLFFLGLNASLLFVAIQYRYMILGVEWGESAFPAASRAASAYGGQTFGDRLPVMWAVGLTASFLGLGVIGFVRRLFHGANKIQDRVNDEAVARAAKGGYPVEPP